MEKISEAVLLYVLTMAFPSSTLVISSFLADTWRREPGVEKAGEPKQPGQEGEGGRPSPAISPLCSPRGARLKHRLCRQWHGLGLGRGNSLEIHWSRYKTSFGWAQETQVNVLNKKKLWKRDYDN